MTSERRELQWLRQAVLELFSEVNCRIEHGAASGGHLEYVEGKLNKMLGRPNKDEKPS